MKPRTVTYRARVYARRYILPTARELGAQDWAAGYRAAMADVRKALRAGNPVDAGENAHALAHDYARLR